MTSRLGTGKLLKFFYSVLLLPCQADARKRKRKRETEVHTARGQGETTALKINQISTCNIVRAFDLLKGQWHEIV